MLSFGAQGRLCVSFCMQMIWPMPVTFLMENYSEPGFLNIGVGTDVTIKDLGRTDPGNVWAMKAKFTGTPTSRTERHVN